MLIKNNNYIMDVFDIGKRGEGIARCEGMVVLIDGALAGERIEAKIIKLAHNYAVGRLIKIIAPSEHRVEPKCEYFKKCGACTLLHLSYEEQLKHKKKMVADCIKRIGGIENFEIENCLGSEAVWRYRNKAQFPVGTIGNDVRLGLYRMDSHELVAIDDCLIVKEQNREIIAKINGFINQNNIPAYDESDGTGILRHVVTRIASSGEIMIILVINAFDMPMERELIKMLKEIGGLSSVVLNINMKKGNTILFGKCKTIYGKGFLEETICGINCKLSPLSFMQIHSKQAENLYNIAVNAVELQGGETVLDAYCGIGVLTQLFTKKCKKVYGVEVASSSVEDARRAARGVSNIEFIEGDCDRILPELIEKILPDVIVLDPPRKGCSRTVIDAVKAGSVNRVIYVSCDPATMARDLKIFCESDYRLVKVWPVDMFPHTGSVECVAVIFKG